MLTVRRSTNEVNSFSDYTANGGVALLEKNQVKTYEDTTLDNESFEQAKERMQRNLDRILNYDKYATEEISMTQSSVATPIQEVEPTTEVEINQCDEDIRPTSTTMQFGDGDIEQMRNEMNRAEEKESTGFRLNSKGKMVVILYALAMAVIMTLIVINTGILTRLGNANAQKAQVIESQVAQLESISAEIENVSNSDYTIDYAENVLGMIK